MAYLKLKTENIKILDNIRNHLSASRIDYIIEIFFKSVLESIGFVKRIVDAIDNIGINKLSNEEILGLITELYDVHFYNNNYLEFFSNYYNKKFVGFKWINTTMIKKVQIQQYDAEKTHLLKSGKQLLSILLKVAYTDNLELIDGYQYSVSEIKEMVNKNKIVILSEGTECIESANDRNEAYYEFNKYKMNNSISSQNMFFSQMMENLKQTIYFQLLNDLKDYAKEIQFQINKVLSYKDCNNDKLRLIGEQCMIILEQHGIYQQIEEYCKKYSKS